MPTVTFTRTARRVATLLIALVFTGALASALLYVRGRAAGVTYYSRGSLPPELLANWSTTRDGLGAPPPNFTGGDIFVIQNGHNMGTVSTWTVSGTGSKVQIESGGTLTANNTVTLASATTFQIDGGGSYVHNNSAAYGSSIFAGTESFAPTSTVTLNNSNTTGPSNVTFGNLTVNLTTDPGGNVQCGGGLTAIAGNFTIVNTQTRQFILTANAAYTLNIGGDLIIQGGTLNLSNGSGTAATMIVNLSGSFNQTGGTFTSAPTAGTPQTPTVNFTGGASLVAFVMTGGTLNNANINWSIAGGKTVEFDDPFTNAASRTFTIDAGGMLLAADTITNNGTLTVNGEFRLTDGGWGTGTNFVYGANGTLGFVASGSYGVNGDAYWPATNGPFNVNVLGFGITMNVARTVGGLFDYHAGVAGAGNLTLNGTSQVSSGGFIASGSPTYGPSSTLKYNPGLSYGRNGEWLPGATSGAGYPNNVQVSNGTTLDLPNGSNNSTFQAAGGLTIDSGSALTLGAMTQALSVLGNVTINGTLTLSSVTGGDLRTRGDFTNTGTFTHNNRAVFFEGGATQTATDAGGTLTLPYVRVNKSGGTVQLGSDLTTLGPNGGDSVQFTGPTSTLTFNGKSVRLGSTVGTAPAGSGFVGDTSASLTLEDGGAAGAMGTLVFASGGQLLGSLTINRTGAGASATLGSDLTLEGALTLTAGDLNTGSFTLTHNGTSSGSSDVVGTVRRTDLGAAARSFGNPHNQISFQTGSAPSEMTVNLVKSAPSGAGFGFPTAVQRTYTITPTGGGGYLATLRLHYQDTELGTNTESQLDLWRFNGSTWTRVVKTAADTAANWVESNAVAQFSPWTLAGSNALTKAKLVEFSATQYDTVTALSWKTSYEVDNLGFNVYREVGGRRALLNSSLIAGSALVAGPGVALTAGNSYEWTDYTDAAGARYYLEEVDLAGRSTTHGPFPTTRFKGRGSKGKRSPLISQLSAPASDEGQRQWTRTDGASAKVTRASEPAALQAAQEKQRWLASRPAVKIAVREAGWYRVTREQLAAAGLSSSADPARLQLYAGGVEVPVRVNPDGSVEFYGQGLDVQSTDTRVYWLVEGDALGLRTGSAPASSGRDVPVPGGGESGGGLTPGTPVVNVVPVKPSPNGPQSFRYTVERRDRTVYFSGLQNGEAENFFGKVVNATPGVQTLTVRNLLQLDAQTAALEVSLQGLTAGEHHVSVSFNGFALGTLDFAGQTSKGAAFQIEGYMLREGDNQVQLASASSGDVSLTDRLRLTYLHTLRADDDRLRFTAPAGVVRVGGFTSRDIRVVDVTNPAAPFEVLIKEAAVPDGQGGWSVRFIAAGAGVERELFAFTNAQVSQPASVVANGPSTWSEAGRQADMVVVTHRDFTQQVAPLVAQREAEGLGVEVVEVEDLFDEFSYGAHTPQAVRDFLAWTRARWERAPAYVLLVGDGTHDPRDYFGRGRYDLVPAKLVDAGAMETASDDWFADFDDDGIADVAVGRLPVRSQAEASTVVGKIVSRTFDPAQPAALLVADRDGADGFSFEAATDGVQSLLPFGASVSRINRRAQDAETVRSQIVSGVNAGPLLVNWMGHGSVDVWTGEGLLRGADAPSLQNGSRLPLFVMMTCLNGYYEGIGSDSIAESVLKAGQGGAYAVWASSGMTEPNAQAAANRELYRILFGEPGVRLGDAVRRAKAGTPDRDVRRTWVFFGDPSSRLR